MSQAEELLNSITTDESAGYTVGSSEEGHIVIGDDRFITVPAELKKIAVQHDHNIETVTFDCPRYWDGHDMSEMAVYINYMRADGNKGSYIADNVTVDDTDDSIMHFSWTLSRNVTEIKGTITFLVCIRKTDEEGNEVNHWNSELNREMAVSEGLECDAIIEEVYPDIITQLLEKIDNNETAIDILNTRIDDNYTELSEKHETDIGILQTQVDANYTDLNNKINSIETTGSVDVSELKTEIAELDEKLSNDISYLRSEMQADDNELRDDISAVDDALTANTNSLQTQIDDNFDTLNTDIINHKTEHAEDVSSLQGQINNIVLSASSSGDVAAEVAAARVGVDGTSHDVLGTRLNVMENHANNVTDCLNAAFGASIPIGKFKNGSWYATSKTITSASWAQYRVVHTKNQYAPCDIKFTPKSGYGITIILFDDAAATTYTNAPGIKYSTTLTVSEGQYYRLCIQKSGVTSGVADVDEYVNAVTMTGKIAELEAAIGELEDQINSGSTELEDELKADIKTLKHDVYNLDGNLIDPDLVGHGRAYQYASSGYASNSDYHYYDVKLDEGETYTVSQPTTGNLYVRFKYSDGRYSLTQNTYPEKSITFIVPDGCTLVTLTCQTANLDKWMLTQGDAVRPYEPYVKYRCVENTVEFQAEMDSLTKVKEDLYKRSGNLIDSTLIVRNYAATNLDGSYTNMGSGYDYIELPLEVGETYTYSSHKTGNLTVRICCYGNTYTKITNTYPEKSITFTVPEGCNIVAFTCQTHQLDTLMLTKGDTVKPYETSNPYRFVEDIDTVCNLTDIISITAHRGYSSLYPENTMIAYEKAYEHGFRRFEADIKSTSDGVLVCLHDDTINRTARNADGTELTETKYISDITYEEASQYNYGMFMNQHFTDCPILKFSDFLIFCKTHNCAAAIDALTDDTVEQAVNMVIKYGMQKYAYFSCFSTTVLGKIREMIPNANISVSRSTAITKADVDELLTWRAGGDFSIGMYNEVATEEICEYVHQKGAKFGVYTVDSKTLYDKFVSWGVDNMATNGFNPKRYRW